MAYFTFRQTCWCYSLSQKEASDNDSITIFASQVCLKKIAPQKRFHHIYRIVKFSCLRWRSWNRQEKQNCQVDCKLLCADEPTQQTKNCLSGRRTKQQRNLCLRSLFRRTNAKLDNLIFTTFLLQLSRTLALVSC